MSTHDHPLPLEYRTELLGRVMPMLRAGECCSLVGLSGVGKSNLIRFLGRPDVQAQHWDTERTWMVLIDTHGLVLGEQPDEFAVAELIIHRLILEAERRGSSSELIEWASDLHARLCAQPSSQLALRSLERVCVRLCDQAGLQLVLMFDQFEDLWRRAADRFFLNLRYLRDQLKYRLVYLVLTRSALPELRESPAATEAFWELFTAHTYGLGMYSPADAAEMLARMAARQGSPLDDALAQRAIELSGRHSGLLRAIFWALCERPALAAPGADLLAVPAIASECAKLWGQCSPDERHCAHILAAGLPLHQPGAPALERLRLTELVAGEPPALFTPLFGDYVLRQSGMDMAGVVVDAPLRSVWLDGQPLLKPLGPLEFELLLYLATHSGTVCRREDIMRELYKEQYYNAGDDRLDTLLRRLREALNEDARHPRYLVTHRGVGVQLKHAHLSGPAPAAGA